MVGSETERRYYSNRMARIYLVAIEDVIGSNGVAAVLRLAKLGHLIGNYPPDSLDREFSFEDFAAINQAVQEVYGPQGAKGLCQHAGRATLKYTVTDGGLMADLPDAAFKLLPPGAKVKVGLTTLAKSVADFSDQEAYVVENEEHLVFVVEQCPECWGRSSDGPICHGTAGMLQEALHWLSDSQEFTAVETECVARGDDVCTFTISRKAAEEGPEGHSATGSAEDAALDDGST
ncbi:MAG: 4-vinyl reductase [Chloroflexi bacterium B3_Chlor]|nr:MAG: 4-vinyl reductase [Chloroflexi bacterium B3_Chlor]